MRVAHFDCFSGISGDMTLGALFGAGVPTEPVLAGIASLGLPIEVHVHQVRKAGFAATQVEIEAPTQNEHRHLVDIERIVAAGRLTPKQRQLAFDIFRRLARAEGAVHGAPPEMVHFHEVGALDSIADIVGAAIGLDLLGVDRFTSGSVPTGKGTVTCAHGVMPVPTPGTAELLRGVPLRPFDVAGELTTPTGAAILTTVVTEWTDTPRMTVEKIGVGAGQKDFPRHPNILRLFVGTMIEASPMLPGADVDRIWVLETNLDDISGEAIGHTFGLLLEAGALDVYTVPLGMKKNRPGVLLGILASEDRIAAIEEIVFRETRTFGIRRHAVERDKLRRRPMTVETPWGPVLGKLGWLEGRPAIFTPEHDACARIARQSGVSLAEVHRAAVEAFVAQTKEGPGNESVR
jgi:pyridinium-3,5-bisthiocarboxylic acid mononucleotide nickel chelatase